MGDTLTAFGLVLLLELGDKTQLAVLGLSARTGRTLAVFIGASLALTAVTAIGVGAGYLTGEALPLEWVSRACCPPIVSPENSHYQWTYFWGAGHLDATRSLF